MKYFIAGREIHSDRDLQTGPLENYYELGWEVISTHLLAKRFINLKKLDPNNDVVVTCKGREFLYSKQIKTICWQEFEKIRRTEVVEQYDSIEYFLETIFQETKDFHDLYVTNSKPEYRYFKEDFNLITNLDFNTSIIPSNKFICFNRRIRKHREQLNMSDEYSINLIKKLQEEYKLPIYITGFHNDIFKQLNNIHLVNLQDWCTLLNSENCLFSIQNQTGTANLTQICGKSGLVNVILDMEGAHFMPIYANGRRPDVLGKSVNFKKIKNLIFLRMPEPTEIITQLNQHVKS
jgi:hypothetical protein